MAAMIEKDGKIEFEFQEKGTVIDLKNIEESLRLLARLVVTLDLRVQALEKK